MDKYDYDKIVNSASKILNIDKSKLDNAKSKENYSDLLENLNSREAEKIKKILADPDETQKILSSKQAQSIIKKLMNN